MILVTKINIELIMTMIIVLVVLTHIVSHHTINHVCGKFRLIYFTNELIISFCCSTPATDKRSWIRSLAKINTMSLVIMYWMHAF